jgi:hypothetical protein
LEKLLALPLRLALVRLLAKWLKALRLAALCPVRAGCWQLLIL